MVAHIHEHLVIHEPPQEGIVLALAIRCLGFGCIGVVGLLLGLVRFDGIGIGQGNREIGTDLRGVVLGQGNLMVRLVSPVSDGHVVAFG